MTTKDIKALATIMRIAKKHREAYCQGDALIAIENEIANYCYSGDAKFNYQDFFDACAGPVGERVAWSEWT